MGVIDVTRQFSNSAIAFDQINIRITLEGDSTLSSNYRGNKTE